MMQSPLDVAAALRHCAHGHGTYFEDAHVTVPVRPVAVTPPTAHFYVTTVEGKVFRVQVTEAQPGTVPLVR